MIYFQRKEINMSGLLSMIGMQTELDYLIGDFPACFGDTPLAIPSIRNTLLFAAKMVMLDSILQLSVIS